MNNFKDLQVWELGISLTKHIYRITKKFPKEEIYGLTSQIRRSAVSVPSNISEGAGRRTGRDFRNFLYIARGSLKEIETQIIIARDLEYVNEKEFAIISSKINVLNYKLMNFIKKIKKEIL